MYDNNQSKEAIDIKNTSKDYINASLGVNLIVLNTCVVD